MNNSMTPTTNDTPLRRSEASAFREGSVHNVTVNDDEEERRQARRRTILQSSANTESSYLEESETLKKCLEMYNGNKLSRDNAWSLSLIDTLFHLLDRHHKSLNNFKVAGSSLEASSRVYGLRVDSVHTDVLRMSAGLNARKFNDRNLDEDDEAESAATGGNDAIDPNSSAAGADAETVATQKESQAKKKQKKQRRPVSTVTKNKETLNARLDTLPLQDPVFGKLNSTWGSVNSSHRLLNNLLFSKDSELQLRMNFKFWDSKQLEKCDYTATVPLTQSPNETEFKLDLQLSPSLLRITQNMNNLLLRPVHSGYIITDTPEDREEDESDTVSNDNFNGADDNALFSSGREHCMAFDIDADCEPMPICSENSPVVDVNFDDFEDLTSEEVIAINKCRGLRKSTHIIEDMRPIDASSKLEYSYRPLDNIQQFWAGPSHWKFRRLTHRHSSILAQQQDDHGKMKTAASQRARRVQQLQARKRSKQIKFDDIHDELFVKIDHKYKDRKANFQKKWDYRKLKLPTDYQFEASTLYKLAFGPGIPCEQPEEKVLKNVSSNEICVNTDDEGSASIPDHFADNDDGLNFMNNSETNIDAEQQLSMNHSEQRVQGDSPDNRLENPGNDTILEINTEYDGAPSQVAKIIVPFAKRAKVIDMKMLKRCCNQSISSQMSRLTQNMEIPAHPVPKNEHYAPGVASFREVFQHLPETLTKAMADSVSPSVAFYSVLHLANENNFRLIQEPDLEDFKILKLSD